MRGSRDAEPSKVSTLLAFVLLFLDDGRELMTEDCVFGTGGEMAGGCLGVGEGEVEWGQLVA